MQTRHFPTGFLELHNTQNQCLIRGFSRINAKVANFVGSSKYNYISTLHSRINKPCVQCRSSFDIQFEQGEPFAAVVTEEETNLLSGLYCILLFSFLFSTSLLAKFFVVLMSTGSNFTSIIEFFVSSLIQALCYV